MTFRERLVAVLKCNGHVLREIDGTVTLPFGSEYSVLIKNLDSVRVQVKVSVDGKDATEGTHLVIQPNSSLELERWIRNGNLSAGNRFKFIERSDAVEAHRGIQVDDGLVRVEAWAEVVRPVVHQPIVHYTYNNWPYYHPYYPWQTLPKWVPPYEITYSMNVGRTTSGGTSSSANNAFVNQVHTNSLGAQCDAGITVPGSESSQQFQPVSSFETESQSRVIVLRLRGAVGRKRVAKAVTVKAKPKCVTCGKVNKGRSRFCTQCGTALELV